MLFQPTNISPSSRGELGNGTVDATKDLAVAWQVNGNSSLVAFSITIYRNDAGSTQVYTTGKLTDGCPFYGVDHAGETVFFSHTIGAAALAAAGVTNGNEYKLIIQQWWSANDSVKQSSAAAFVTRATPSLTLEDVPEIMETRHHTFLASYSQAQGDALNWVRWMLAAAGEEESPLYDSQNIYGTAELKMTYDGFFRGTEYAVRCLVQTEKGQEADTGWVPFLVEYDANPLEGAVKASIACGRSAVKLEWPLVQYVPGSAEGDYAIEGGILTLGAGGSVTWSQVNEGEMAFPVPWSILWKTKLNWGGGTLLTIGQEDGDLAVVYDYFERTLTLLKGEDTLYQKDDVRPAAGIVIILTEDTLYLRLDEMIGGLYPSATLYPGVNLFPQGDSIPRLTMAEEEIAYDQEALTAISLGGPQVCQWVKVIQGDPTEEVLTAAWERNAWTPEYDDGCWFLCDFTNGLSGGNLGASDDELTGLAIYRREGTSGTLQHLGDLGLAATAMLDYSARSGQGPYTYYLFPLGERTYISEPIESEQVDPCFWDWTVLACQQRADGTYQVEEEYRFGKNLSSGTMSNNNSPSLLENFTPYPTVQLSPVCYRSGTLQSLIGVIDYVNGDGYSDTLTLRDAIYRLSLADKDLFLKSRKGDLFRIRVSGPITMATMDNTRQQAQTVSLPWAETGTAEGASLTVTPGEGFWDGGDGTA